MKYDFNPEELTKEKSLWDIYKLSRKIQTTIFNKIVLIAVFVLSIGYVFFLQNDGSIGLFILNFDTWFFNSRFHYLCDVNQARFIVEDDGKNS